MGKSRPSLLNLQVGSQGAFHLCPVCVHVKAVDLILGLMAFQGGSRLPGIQNCLQVH